MWMFANKFKSDVRLDGKTAIVTGGNAGIGKETVRDLYKRGARVYILCRDQEKSKLAIEEIQNESKSSENTGELFSKYLDLSDISSVHLCADGILKQEPQIHLLINNAGIFGHPVRQTKDGFDMHFCVNYLAHFLLTLLLLPALIKANSSRIINVTSTVQQSWLIGADIHFEDLHFNKRKFTTFKSYSESKLALVMFTEELRKRLNVAGIEHVTIYSVHPGVISSDIGRNLDVMCYGFSWFWKYFSGLVLMTPKQGMRTTLYCVLDEKLEKQSHIYYDNCKEGTISRHAFDEQKTKQLWDVSIELLALQNYNPFQIYDEDTQL